LIIFETTPFFCKHPVLHCSYVRLPKQILTVHLTSTPVRVRDTAN